MRWDKEAISALKSVPVFVRPLAKRKVEGMVRAQGRDMVSLADYRKAKARFDAVRGGRSEKGLGRMLPAENLPGTSLFLLESCRHELARCPNALIDTTLWREALEEWLANDSISGRLRAGITDSKVLYHHKLKLAVSGCPNGCARPQVADLAVVGALRPSFRAEACTSCGECAAACPDRAISLAPEAVLNRSACQGCTACSKVCGFGAVETGSPFARLYAGGKLGRHPHLADFVGIAVRPEQAVELFSRYVEEFLRHGEPNQRFAAWWGKGAGNGGPARIEEL